MTSTAKLGLEASGCSDRSSHQLTPPAEHRLSGAMATWRGRERSYGRLGPGSDDPGGCICMTTVLGCLDALS